MGKSRPRYNEKARASSRKPTQRPHPRPRDGGLGIRPDEVVIEDQDKKQPVTSVEKQESNDDPNVLMIIPGEKKETTTETKKPLPQPTKFMSKKKRKKLEKYIDQKLKKEARAGLMEKLSTSSWSSELLQSSKNIGRPRQTVREQLRQALLEQKAGISSNKHEEVRLFVEKEVDDEMLQKQFSENKSDNATTSAPAQAPMSTPVVGSALQQTPDGPAISLTKRKRKKKKSTIPEAARKRYKMRKGMESDTSFDSSDSEYDDKEIDEQQPKESIASLLELDNKEERPTALEEAIEAAKNVPAIQLRQEEEHDEMKLKLLKSNREGDLSDDVAKPFYVSVDRPAEVQEARLKLPVCGEEQVIMEAIRNNTVVIICGETGSGKTTQVPQFLYEAGYSHPESDNPGIIGITQPRRVAAVSMAKRVAHELNLSDKQVSYQIRYDGTTSEETRIKFMTDGVLLREMAEDLLLTKYSVIIIDEAHERNLNTDILIGVISRVLKLRAEMSRENRQQIKPLRVVIMSATLRVSDFTENKTLFDRPPPVINVDARQFPVSIHFNKRTPEDYVAEAYKKVCKIHQRLPPGGILVFLTGQNEINHLCKLLRRKYPSLPPQATKQERKQEKNANALEKQKDDIPSNQVDIEDEDVALGENDEVEEDFDLESDDDEEESDIEFDFGDEDEEFKNVRDAPLHVLPLYSLLPTEAQLRVFRPPPEGTRLCVVATNVAETSVTIPGIRYVVDCGKVKERKYNTETGIQSYEIGWTSKASADQRAGRAGRTQAGHCYRLYSSAVFDHEFPKFSLPEIQRMPLEGVVLNMKAMHIDQVVNFPFPTPPPRESLYKAEKLLEYLGGIDEKKQITKLGSAMAIFPVAPRLARMLLLGNQHGCLPYVIIMVAALSVGNPFQLDDPATVHKQIMKLSLGKSDIITLVKAVGAYEYADGSDEFCQEHGLRPKAMLEIRQLRRQLTNIVAANFPNIDVCLDPKLPPPNTTQIKVLQQILAAGFIDCIAVRADLVESGSDVKVGRLKNCRGVPYQVMWSDELAYIHPTSVIFTKEPPAMVAYNEIVKATKTYIKGITVVEPKWLFTIGRSLCTFGKPLDYPLPKPVDNRDDRRLVYVVPQYGPKGWPLPAIEVEQRRIGTRWVLGVEK